MASPYHHSVSSARKYGGEPSDYIAIHQWFDESKAMLADFRHRALRHHTEGIFLCEKIFGPTITLSCTCESKQIARIFGGKHDRKCTEGKKIPTRWIGEQHVLEDLGRIPTAAEWLLQIQPLPWMNRSRRLSVELEREAV